MSNEEKNRALGMNFSTASQRLRKMVLFDLLQRFDLDRCFRCEKRIADIGDLSIEHKEPWQGATNPKDTFFDLENIAFSHGRCNSGAADRNNSPHAAKTHCPAGHPYDEENTYYDSNGHRACRKCRCDKVLAYRRTERGRERQRAYHMTDEYRKMNRERMRRDAVRSHQRD